jgi:WD40 repeat protein
MPVQINSWKLKSIVGAWLIVVVALPVCGDPTTAPPNVRQVRIQEFSKPILAFDIANGSDLAAAALSDLHVRVWQLESGKLVHELSFEEPETDKRLKDEDDVEPISLRFSPDGKTLAVSFVNAIHLYNVETWHEETSLSVTGEDKPRPDIKITPARPELTKRTPEEANAERSKPVPDINQTMRELSALKARGDGRTRIVTFEFAKDGSSILASYCRSACYVSTQLGLQSIWPTGKDPLRLWNVSSSSPIWERFYDPKGVISRVVPLPDGRSFIAVNSELGHCTVGGYDLGAGQTRWSHSFGPCLRPPSIVMLADGLSFITNRIDEANRANVKRHLYRYGAIYDTNTGEKIVDLKKADGISVADISSDRRWLASITWTGTQFQIWDLQARKIIVKGFPNGWKPTPNCVLNRVRLSPDNHWLVVGCDGGGEIAVYQWAGNESRSSLSPR